MTGDRASVKRLAVCEAPAELDPGGEAWRGLAGAVRAARPDLFLLNEMPFGSWIAVDPHPDQAVLAASQRAHDVGMNHLAALGCPLVLGTRPIRENGHTVNQGFLWSGDGGTKPVHTKQYFPAETGYYEAAWFARGETHFRVVHGGGVRVGFLICTEVMFNEWARHYRRQGAHLIAVPRATPGESLRRWQTAVAMAAVVSGCYVATSNRVGTDRRGRRYGGTGWIVDPFGDVVAETSGQDPVATAELDLSLCERAQREYPCYVEELHP